MRPLFDRSLDSARISKIREIQRKMEATDRLAREAAERGDPIVVLRDTDDKETGR